MADEDITLDGKPLHSLRVADLKAALEQRNLPKSGQKNALIKRLKGALMLENLQRSSSSHIGLQPNSQMGEEMSQNSFIKQYLAKQQELLRQKLERGAQQVAEDDESSGMPEEEEDHTEGSDSSSFLSDGHNPMPSQPSLTRTEEEGGGPLAGQGMTGRRPDMGPGSIPFHQESPEAPGAWLQRSSLQPGLEEPPAPSPPRAVASLSVRVLGQPDRQGLPPTMSRAHEKEGTAPAEPGTAYSVLHLSRSAGPAAGGHVQEDSDEEEDDDESEEDDDWGPTSGMGRRGSATISQSQQPSPCIPMVAARSRRKLQPPQHIPPLQVHQPPMQLRHPTPPPSPPPELSFPLPDTPKQSPPDTGDMEDEGNARSCHPTMRKQDSDSSSCSSSPEPRPNQGPGPLSLFARKVEAEGAFPVSEAPATSNMSGVASSSRMPLQHMEQERHRERRENEEKERQLREEEEEGERKRLEEREKERRRLKKEDEREMKQLEEKEKERSHLEEERGKERKRLEEERKRLEEERNREKMQQEEERDKDRKRQAEERIKEEKQLEAEKQKQQEAEKREKNSAPANISTSMTSSRGKMSASPAGTIAPTTKGTSQRGSVVVSEAQDSGSISDSDSGSDSSQCSSQSSSSSSRDKPHPDKQLKKPDHRHEAEDERKRSQDESKKRGFSSEREVSEPSTAALTEVDPDLGSSMAQQPASEADPKDSEGRLEESTTPKTFAARKISLTTGTKMSPASTEGATCGVAGDSETGGPGGRKRRWGSSTAVTAKKPSISITTDSLKSLIPDIKLSQDAVVELHAEELQLSGDEENQVKDHGQGDKDKGLKIRRTVTQVVSGDSQENGQENEEEKTEREKQSRVSRDKRKNSQSEETMETQNSVQHDTEAKKVTTTDNLVRRSISQQKSGVSITIDDPVRMARQPSPPHGKLSNILHVTNLVRPFTLGQLKELLNQTGSVVEDGFWINKIKSHCYVTYTTPEEALATRTALHGVKWPQSNPKLLCVDFCEQDEVDFHKGLLKPDRGEEDQGVQPVVPHTRLPPLMPERDRERDRSMGVVRDQWAEREKEMERRERTRGEREWDRDKIREFGRPTPEGRRSRSRDRDRKKRERAKSKERKSDKKEKADEPPAKLVDDLFLKTKAAPCIYWLPLTDEQVVQKVLDRAERQKEREKRRKELQEEEDKKREEEKKERLKGREKEGGGAAAAAAAVVSTGSVGGNRRGPDVERKRARERDGDRKRDGHRPSGTSRNAASGRRSRSRSNARDRRH